MKLLVSLQNIDRRYIYALLLLSVTLPFFITFQLPTAVTAPTQSLYNTIEGLPSGSFAVVGIDWSAGSRGENRPQTTLILRHLMKKHIRFIMLAFSDPQGATLGEELAQQLGKEYGAVEGRDWANFGYQVDIVNWLKAFTLNIPKKLKADVRGVPEAQLPVMAGINTAADISLMVDITSTGVYQTYIQFLAGPYHSTMKMGVGLTAVMSPDAYNYLDSHQIVGMMAGLTGAEEYQTLFAKEYDASLPQHSRLTRYSNSLSASHLLIIILIFLGNMAMFLEKRENKKRQQE